MDDTFIYSFSVPATSTTIRLSKADVVHTLEGRLGRPITAEEGVRVWKELRTSDAWYKTFPAYAETRGMHIYGASDYEFYMEAFEPHITGVVQEIVEKRFADVWTHCFAEELDSMEAGLRGEITFDTVEQYTQKQIQDDNVRSGLARCANETKAKSVEKWKKNYLQKRLAIQLPAADLLPAGKTADDFLSHVASFFC